MKCFQWMKKNTHNALVSHLFHVTYPFLVMLCWVNDQFDSLGLYCYNLSLKWSSNEQYFSDIWILYVFYFLRDCNKFVVVKLYGTVVSIITIFVVICKHLVSGHLLSISVENLFEIAAQSAVVPYCKKVRLDWCLGCDLNQLGIKGKKAIFVLLYILPKKGWVLFWGCDLNSLEIKGKEGATLILVAILLSFVS